VRALRNPYRDAEGSSSVPRDAGSPHTEPAASPPSYLSQTSHFLRPAGGEPSSRFFGSIFLPSEQSSSVW